MKKKKLIIIVIAWCLLKPINYYFIPYFILALEWLILSLVLLICTINQLIKLIKERKKLTKLRVVSTIVIGMLFFLTIYQQPVNRVIEKMDWYIFYSHRMEIVEKVKNKELNSNVSWNNGVCELPYEFPVVSNGGNDIVISRNDENNSVTVTFWVFRNFFSSHSTHFTYTNDAAEIKRIENLIEENPEGNWKIEKNWYRTHYK